MRALPTTSWSWWTPSLRLPKRNKRTELLGRLKVVFRSLRSQPVGRVITLINPILRGWVNYFAHGNASRCFSYIRDWVEKKVRRRLSRNSKRSDFGWKRWSRASLYDALGLFSAYRVHRGPRLTALPADYVTRQDYSGTKPETADTAGSRPYQLLVRRPRGSRRGALTLLIARSPTVELCTMLIREGDDTTRELDSRNHIRSLDDFALRAPPGLAAIARWIRGLAGPNI